MVRYTYQPIEGRDEIRVLNLEPGEKGEQLRGDFIVTTLSSKSGQIDQVQESSRELHNDSTNVKYEALSYVWGSSEKPKVFNTPHGYIPITESLSLALCSLRKRNEPHLIWADALCINQDNVKEKNVQVRLMTRIYTMASRVVAYLGPEADGSNEAIKLLEFVHGLNLNKEFEDERRKLAWIEGTGDSILPNHRDKCWDTVRALLRRPWFTRVWVVQEIVAAPDAILVCGEQSFTVDTIATALEKLAVEQLVTNIFDDGIDFGAEDDITEVKTADGGVLRLIARGHPIGAEKMTSLAGAKNFFAMASAREVYRKHNLRYPFIVLARNFKLCKATDPRDYLFALRGLALDTGESAFDPDYEASLEDIVTKYAVALLKCTEIRHILREATFGLHQPAFPSWIPPWTLHNPLKPEPIEVPELPEPLYAACSQTQSFALAGDGQDKGHLFIRGCIIDNIKATGQPYHHVSRPGADGWGVWTLASCMRTAEVLVARSTSYCSTMEKGEALWRTLIANRDSKNRPATRDVVAAFLAFAQFSKVCTEEEPNDDLQIKAGTYSFLFARTMDLRKPCVSTNGYFGIVPEGAQPEDALCIFLGIPVPYVLRRSEEVKNAYRIVGDAYIHGFMQGEALSFPEFDKDNLIRIH